MFWLMILLGCFGLSWNVQIPKAYDTIETSKEKTVKRFTDNIRHGGGTHHVEVEIDGDRAVLSFGASFTLRLDETNLVKLGQLVSSAQRELCIERRDRSDAQCVDVFELEETDMVERDWESSAEAKLIQAGIDAREKLKEQKMMKGTASAGTWNPDDPANW